jgi:hypothetical protein
MQLEDVEVGFGQRHTFPIYPHDDHEVLAHAACSIPYDTNLMLNTSLML